MYSKIQNGTVTVTCTLSKIMACNVPANRGFKSNMVRVSLVITCDVLSLSTNSGSLVPVTEIHVPGRLIVCDSCYY